MCAWMWTGRLIAGIILSGTCFAQAQAADLPAAEMRDLIRASQAAAQEGDMVRAVALHRSIVQASPTKENWITMAELENAVGGSRREEAAWLSVIEIDPSYWPAYVALGRLYLAQDNLASAFDYFQKCASQAGMEDPSYAAAMNGIDAVMARSPYYRDKIIQARAAQVQSAMEIENTQWNKSVLERQMRLYKSMIGQGRSMLASKDYRKALESFDTALHFVPGDDEAVRLRRAAVMGLEQETRTSMTESAINTILSSRTP